MQEQLLISILPNMYEKSALIRSTWNAAGVKPSDIRSLDGFLRGRRDRQGLHTKLSGPHSDPLGGLQIAEKDDLTVIGFTSGTTGDPTPVPVGRLTSTETEIEREFWHIGARPGDYVTYMMFTFRGGQARLGFLGEAGITPIVMPHDPAELPLMIEAIEIYKPTVFYMLSTPIMIGLERFFETHPEKDPKVVFASIKGGVFGGEPMSPRFAALARSWGLEIFDYATLGDVTGAMECRAHNGFHAWEDLALVENLDEDGNPVPDGAIGEMVVTALADPWAPLVRFRTGDLCRMDHSPCSCGRTHLRFWTLGRKGDQTTVEGRTILPRDIQRLVEQHNETRSALFQIIRPQPVLDVLRLRVGYDPNLLHDTHAALGERPVASISGDLAVRVEIELVVAEELLKLGPPQKIPKVTLR